MNSRILITLLLVISIISASAKPSRYMQSTRLDIDDNISSLFVVAVEEDPSGIIWIATDKGLNRFDGISITPILSETSGLRENAINTICVDKFSPYIWIGTQARGIDRYNRESGEFTSFVNNPNDPTSIADDSIVEIKQGSNGDLWFATRSSGLSRLRHGSDKFEHFNEKSIPNFSKGIISSFDIGLDGNIYMGYRRGGLTILNPATKTTRLYYSLIKEKRKLPSNYVQSIYCDKSGRVWIGTLEGISLYNPIDKSFINYELKDANGANISTCDFLMRGSDELLVATDFNGIFVLDTNGTGTISDSKFSRSREFDKYNQTTIRSILEDKYNNLWLGIYGYGVEFISAIKPIFTNYTPKDPLRLINTQCMCYDKSGNIWVGTDGGGVDVVRNGEVVKNYNSKLSSKSVTSLICDDDGKIWIGTLRGGITVYNPSQDRFHHLKLNKETAIVRCLYEDGERMFIGGDRGIEVVDKSSFATLASYRYVDGLPENDVVSIAVDKHNRIWIGMYSKGVMILDQNMNRLKLLNAKGSKLPSNSINHIYLDSDGTIWIATKRGVVSVSDFKNIPQLKMVKNPHLRQTEVMAMAEDGDGNMWFSCDQSIKFINASDNDIVDYNYQDGIVGGNYISGGVTKRDDKVISFVSTNGITSFDYTNVSRELTLPPVRFNEFQLLNHSDSGVQNMYIGTDNSVGLEYDQNNLQIRFSVPNFALRGLVEYTYRIVGVDNNWYGVDEEVILRHLAPGNYNIEIKSRLRNREWSEDISRFSIKIHPPFWLTWWAITIYVLFAIAVAVVIFRIFYTASKRSLALDSERKLVAQQQRINDERLYFYTNITHELRTPLTLILAPLENLKEDATLSTTSRRKVEIAHKSASQLKTLINQLLEFRKCDTQHKRLSVSTNNISQHISEIGTLFRESNDNPNINIKLSLEDNISLMYDREVINLILNNLLSNALKYTSNGSIVLSLRAIEIDNIEYVEIEVKDDGCGIAESEIDRIFDRYYQVENKLQASGTGIGLALVKSLVALHQAAIVVESEVGVGTSFKLRLERLNLYGQIARSSETYEIPEKIDDEDTRAVILVIDDNHTICEYLTDILSSQYQVITAHNGEEGYRFATTYVPNLIISDVMMPVMDGIELCNKIKTDINTSHIPVILLTAKGSQEAQTVGYSCGADSYITKPFNENMLMTRIRNLLDNRSRIAQLLSSATTTKSELKRLETELPEIESTFMKSVNSLIEENLELEELDVNFLAEHLYISLSTLYRKIKSVTGISTNEYIRKIRMRRAAELLSCDDVSIKEVAYRVGFSDLAYFRQCFKSEYGIAPSKYNESSKISTK